MYFYILLYLKHFKIVISIFSYILLGFLLATPHILWNINSLTREQILFYGSESTKN